MPAFSRQGRPLGKSSSMTRYSHSSALTKGVPSSRPSALSMAATEASGPGVILSIIDQGKETLSASHLLNPSPPHFCAKQEIAALSLSPLWEQLSMLTMASGALFFI